VHHERLRGRREAEARVRLWLGRNA
jgi:hypothetical protein